MTSSIKLKRSAVGGKIPQTGDLQLGEIAINTFDGKIYIKKNNGVESIIAIGNGTGGADSYIVTGDVTGTLDNVGANELTLADVNEDVGNFGTTNSAVTLTLNAKGQVTAASANLIAIAASQTTTGQFADARISSSSVTQHAADLVLDESQITPGAILARLNIIGPAVQVFDGLNEFTSPVTGVSPTNAFHLTTKQYVDSIAAGLDPKESCLVATTGPVTLAGLQSIDGFSVPAGGRILVKDQADGSENGIYVADASNWPRADDFDGSPSAEVSTGAFTLVVKGTENGATGWVLLTDDPIAIGTTPLVFTQFSAASAGGTVMSVDASGGSTGLTFSGGPITNAGTLILGGTLAIGNGGTGATTQAGAANAILPLQSLQAGKFLSTNGANVSWQPVNTVAGNNGQMLFNNNGFIDAANSMYTDGINKITGEQSNVGQPNAFPPTGGDLIFQGGNADPLATDIGLAGSVYITAGHLLGGGDIGSSSGSVVLSAPAGGQSNTGNVRVLTAGVERFRITPDGEWSIGSTGADVGVLGAILVSQGPGTPPIWQPTTGAGTVTSIDASGGTTGLDFTGGPVTASGTLTLTGTLAAANGGTGLVSPTGYLLGNGATIVASATIPAPVLTGNLAIGRFNAATGANTNTFWRGDGTWATPVASSGTVSSIDVDGGATGLDFTGGPVTSTGVITMSGVLGTQYGGTGVSELAKVDAFTSFSPVTSQGDLIIGNGLGQAVRLGLGGNGTILTSNGTTASWQLPATSGGTVTSVAVTSANGVSASVSNATTTPNLTFSLGAITPSSITMASGNQFFTNLGGIGGTNYLALGLTGVNLRLGVAGTLDALMTGTDVGDVVLNYTGSLFMGHAGQAPKLLVDNNDNVVLGSSAVSTSATDGFTYITTTTGQPLGTPTSFAGRQPMVIDTTNGVMYFYTGVTWKATNTGGNPTAAGLQGYVQYNNAGGLGANSGFLFTPASQTLTVGNGTLTSAVATSNGTDSSFSINTGAGSSASGITLLAGTSPGAGDITLTAGSTTNSVVGVSNIMLNAAGGIGTYDSTHGTVIIRTGAIGIITTSNTLVDRLSILPGGAWSVGTGGSATGTSGQVLSSTGALTPPVWGLVDLSTSVTGNLSVTHFDSGTNASNTTYLRGDGTWVVPPGSGGTVTSVSIVTANGVSGSVATQTTTPAITLTLGAITPTSVAASGNVSGATLSGTLNTVAQPNITSVGTLTSLNVTGNITAADPTTASQVATKQYVDNLATGLSPKSSVRAATLSNIINLATVNGAIGTTLDGVTLASGDRILIKNQTTSSQNGIWIYNGAAALATRAPDFDGSPISEVEPGTYVLVISGTVNATSGWIVNNTGTGTGGAIVVGTDPITFVQFSAGGAAAPFNVKDEGVSLTTTVTAMDFVGAGVTATNTGGAVTVTVNATVSSVAVTTANGVSASVANSSTTPTLTFTLGAITPTSVASSGAVSGTAISGTTGAFTSNVTTPLVSNSGGVTISTPDVTSGGSAGINITTGSVLQPSASQSGSINIAAGDFTFGGSGGAVNISGGDWAILRANQGAGGPVTIRGGDAGDQSLGGTLTLSGGGATTGGAGGGTGGSVVINAGTGATPGSIVFSTGILSLSERMRITGAGALTFAGVAGTANQVLTSNGSGVPSWQAVPAATAGSTTQVIFNSSGTLTGSANMTWDGATLTLTRTSTVSQLELRSTAGVPVTIGFGRGVADEGQVAMAGTAAQYFNDALAGDMTIRSTVAGVRLGGTDAGGTIVSTVAMDASGNLTLGNAGFTILRSGGTTASPTERLRILANGQWNLAGVAATSGQVLTTVTAGQPPVWAAPTGGAATSLSGTGTVSLTSATTGVYAAVNAGTTPLVEWTNSAGVTDGKVWIQKVSGNVMQFSLVNDAISADSFWMEVTRTGAASTLIKMTSATINLTGNVTTTGNLSMTSATGARFLFDNSSATFANKFSFQPSNTPAAGFIQLMPSTGGTAAGTVVFPSPTLASTSYGVFGIDSVVGGVVIDSGGINAGGNGTTGTGLPIIQRIMIGGTITEVARTTTTAFQLSHAAPVLTGNFSNAAATNRLTIQTNQNGGAVAGTGATIVQLLPNLNAGVKSGTNIFVMYSQSAIANASYFNMAIDEVNTQAFFDTGFSGTGTQLPMIFKIANAEKVRVSSTGVLNIGGGTTTNAIGGQLLEINSSGSGVYGGLAMTNFSASANQGPILTFQRSYNNTANTHTFVANDQTLGYILWQASDGTAFQGVGDLRVGTDFAGVGGTTSTTNLATRMEFLVAPAGTKARAVRLTLDSLGSLVMGPSFGTTGALLTSATGGFLHLPASPGTPAGTPVAYLGRVPITIDSTNNLMYMYSNAAWRLVGGSGTPATVQGATGAVGGTASVLGGTATGGAGGPVVITAADGVGGAFAGGAVTITSGTGATTGPGGLFTLQGGSSGPGTGANGGNMRFLGGAATGTGAGGQINISGGTSTSGVGGAIVISTGPTLVERLRISSAGEWLLAGASSTAGQVLTSGGPGAVPTWAGAAAAAGSLTGTTLAANVVTSSITTVGSPLIINAASAVLTGPANTVGSLAIVPGVINPSTTGNALTLTGGTSSGGNSVGGAISITGGAGVGSLQGGATTLQGGSGFGGGGTTVVQGGNSTGTGAAGFVSIVGGTNSSGNAGGYIVLSTSPSTAANQLERLRILNNGAWSVGTGGAATGTAGQVLTSAGALAPPTWASTPYDLATFAAGLPAASATLFGFAVPRAMTIVASLVGSAARAGTAATGSSVFSVNKNGAQIGTVTFAAAATTGTFAGAGASFVAGDLITIVAPSSPDSTLADIAITLVAAS